MHVGLNVHDSIDMSKLCVPDSQELSLLSVAVQSVHFTISLSPTYSNQYLVTTKHILTTVHKVISQHHNITYEKAQALAHIAIMNLRQIRYIIPFLIFLTP